MAYNPFDDVIEQDPAYMANGGQPYRAGQAYQERITKPAVQEDIARGSETMANIARGPINFVGDVFAQTLGRLAENMVNPEAAERGRQKFAINKEIAKYYNTVPGAVTDAQNEMYFKRFGKEMQRLTFEEGINQGLDFILSDAIAGSKEIQAGKNFTDLDGAQQLGVALLPIEFWFGGAGARKGVMKGAEEFKKQYAGKPIAEVINDSKVAAEYPEIIAEMKNTYPMLVIGKGVDEGRIALMAEKGEGLPASTKAKRDKIFLEKRGIREQEIVNRAQQFDTKAEAIADSGLSKSQFNKVLRNRGLTASDLGLKVGKRGTPDTSAEKKKILDDFLAANPDKKFTRSELAEATGLAKSYVKDPRIYQTDAPNLVTYASKQAEDFDNRIKGMNKLIEDIQSGLIQPNKGPGYYRKEGYDIPENITKNYLDFPQKGQFEELSISNKNLSELIGKKSADPNTNLDALQNYFNVSEYKNASTYLATQKIKLRDFIRDIKGTPQEKEFVDIIKDPEVFGFLPKKILGKDGSLIPNPELLTEAGKAQNQKALDNLRGFVTSLSSKEDMAKLADMQRMKKELDKFADQEFFNLLDNNQQLQQQFISEVNRVDPDNAYNNDWKKAFNFYKNRFHGQLSHVMSKKFLGTPKQPFKKAPGLRFKKGETGLMRINFDNHNISLQPRLENVTMKTVKQLSKKDLTTGDLSLGIQDLNRVNNMLNERGMMIYMRFTDKEMSDQAFELLRKQFPDQVFKTDESYGKTPKGVKTIMLGQPEEPDLNQLKSYLKATFATFNQDPSSFKLSAGAPKSARPGFADTDDVMMETGDNPYIYQKFLNPSAFEKGGPVRMAIGGDPLQNINQQQFTPDPAIDDDFFQQAVESENLLAFNPVKIFQKFGEVKAVDTPKKKIETDAPVGPPGSNLPTTQDVQPDDFAFKSFTLEKIVSPTAPKSARPQDWVNFLQGGDAAPLAELKDSGIEQYLRDFEKYFPNQKITQEQLVDYYETSPMGNLAIKVKEADPIPLSEGDSKMIQSAGQPRHRNVGNQPLDEVGKQYREIVVTAGRLPGETKPFVSSGHFSEENVIGFTRVADYDTPSGQKVAVIQELQTDMLTQVRKEQERVKALFARIEKIKEKANRLLQSTDEFDRRQGQQLLDSINNAVSEKQLKMLQDNPTLIKPFPNEAAKGLIPQYAEEIDILQNQIDAAVKSDLRARKPETQFVIKSIAEKQQEVLDNLLDLNRAGELDRDLSKVQVPGGSQSNEIAAFGETNDAISDYYSGMKELEIFPAIPFNKQADYVDLLVKSTIKDAESKGIQKVAIMPAEKVNMRWGKDPDGPEGKKFKNLYDKVVKQQMQNIAKKYGATFQVEQIVDPTKATKGLRFFNRDVDGGLKLNKEDVARRTSTESEEGIDEFYNEQMRKFVSGGGYRDKDVVLVREVAPGQFQDFYVRADDDSINLVPLGEGETINDALIVIEEFNPSLVDMFVLTMPDEVADKPFFLFKKKDGGSIAKDSLVSITDIFGEYGR